MTFPWESMRPELQKDANGLYPGQQHPMDIPNFLNRATNLPATAQSWVPPWVSKS